MLPDPSNSPRVEAATWLARLHAEDRSEADIRAFQKWLDASPEHSAAFEAVNAIWDCAGALPRDLRRSEPTAHPTRRKLLIGSVAAMLTVSAGAALLRPAGATTYKTGVGERKKVSLTGHSELLLDTDTRVDVTDGTRAIQLLQGCAELTARDNEPPFTLAALGSTITVQQARMTLRCDETRLSVLVISGTAQVDTAPGQRIRLEPGDRLIADGQDVRLDRPDLAPLLAWRNGQAIFQNTRLADAVAEMNRYSRTRLEIEAPPTRELRLSGTFALGNSAAFAGAVAILLPVRTRAVDGRIEILPDPARSAGG